MARFKGHCADRATAIDRFLSTLAERPPTPKEAIRLEELCTHAKDQFERMHAKWETVAEEIPDDATGQAIYKKCEDDYNESKEKINTRVEAAEAKLKEVPDESKPPQNTTGSSLKIDDILKPKDLLMRSMTLEEADEWFESYRAFLAHNEKVLVKQDIKVNRALLNKSIEAALASALRAHPDVVAGTPITAQGGCLDKLRDIFLEKNPLWLRRHYYFKCIQQKGETVSEWWVRKTEKGRECNLADIKADDIRLLELIRGVNSPKLRQEFLRQKDPTLEDLLRIARNWQVADEVEKNLDTPTTTVDVRKTSNYKKDKNAKWEEKTNVKEDSSPMKDANSCSYCGRNPNHPRPQCPAKDKDCCKCGKPGHFGIVCQSSTPGRGGGQNRGRSRSRARPRPRARNNTESSTETKSVRVSSTRVRSRPSRPSSKHVPEVRCGKIAARRAVDDAEATPLMEEVEIKPSRGTPFKFDVFPDTGCYQSLISLDLVNAYGMHLYRDRIKRIKAVDGGHMKCNGSVSFQATYQGRKTEVLALVTPALQDEILLSWRALQRLGVIPKEFPNSERVAKAEATPTAIAMESPTGGTQPASPPSSPVRDEQKKPNYKPPGLKGQVEALIREHAVVFDAKEQLKIMKGGPMHIKLKDGPIKPLHVNTPRKTPYAFQDKAKAKLDQLVDLKIMEKVDDVSSEWCSPMSFVPKADGDVRPVVDLVHLNKYVERPVHPFPTPKDIIAMVPGTLRYFAVFDAKNGYWQIPLDDQSKPLTTFITEWGRYRYLRAPMGLASSGDEFCQRTDQALSGITGVSKLVDDVLVVGNTAEQLLERIKTVFERCEEHDITLSQKKYQLGTEVKFAGYVVSAQGVRPDPEKIASIARFPIPENLTDLRSFLGLANQFSDFSPDLRHAMEPMKGLLKKQNAFVWNEAHTKSMDAVKAIITGPQCLAHFNPKLPTTLLTDASRTGLGYVLIQTEETLSSKPVRKLITCGSRFLSEAEGNYAVVELELLAIQWAVKKCRLYLAGAQFEVITDHQPLVSIMNGRNLDAIQNARIHRLMSKLLGYTFKVSWTPGKTQCIADALSRNPVFKAEEAPDVLVCGVLNTEEPQGQDAEGAQPVRDPALEKLTAHAKADSAYQKIREAVKGRKAIDQLPTTHPAQALRSQWDALSTMPGLPNLLLYHGRIVVPDEAKAEVLKTLHVQHTGEPKTLANARQLYFWVGMTRDIKLTVATCQLCLAHKPSQRLEPQIQTTSSRPWEAVSVDLGYYRSTHYLVLMDRYSGWPLVQPLRKLDTAAVTTTLDDWFLEYGKPISIRSDGGPQFRNDFTKWCEGQRITHQLTSAYHHESNGHAEVAIREMKNLLSKTKDFKAFKVALREWRNTPRFDGLSPSQWLTGRRQRTEAVAAPEAYRRISDLELQAHEAQRGRRYEQVKASGDQASRILEPLQPGEAVLVQDSKTKKWSIEATITAKRNERSYEIDINGRTHIRNRRFLRPAINPGSSPTNLSQVPSGLHQGKGPTEEKTYNLRKKRRVKFRD